MTQKVVQYVREIFDIEPDFPFDDSETAVFRNRKNKKWFGIIIPNLPKSRLGLATPERADILNLKCDPLLHYAVVDHQRIFPAYHMNKTHWITVLLDGSVSLEEMAPLIHDSYDLIEGRRKSGKVSKKDQRDDAGLGDLL